MSKKKNTPPPRFFRARGFILAIAIFCPFIFTGCKAENILYDNVFKMFLLIIIVCSLPLALFAYFIFSSAKKHKEFIRKAKSIQKNMTFDEVKKIMYINIVSIENDGNRTIVTCEKRQWKGFFFGGTLTRAIKIVFENDLVLYTVSKYLDVPIFPVI